MGQLFQPKYPTLLGCSKMLYIAALKRKINRAVKMDAVTSGQILNEFINFLSAEIYSSKLRRERLSGCYSNKNSCLVTIAKRVCKVRVWEIEVQAKNFFDAEISTARCDCH